MTPINLYGHVFIIINRKGVKMKYKIWSDTIMIQSEKTVEALFVADNRWLVIVLSRTWTPQSGYGHYDKGRLMVSPSLGVFN